MVGEKLCRLGKESITWFSFVCYHGNVCERKRELLLISTAQHKASIARNKLLHGLETTHGSRVIFKCKKKNSSVMNRHPQRGWVDGQFAKVIWELDQTKHTCNLAWMTAWKSHAEFPSKLRSCSSHMGFALPFFFFLNFVECLQNGACMHNMGLTKTLFLKPEDYNSSGDIGDILMALSQYRLV